MTTTASQARDWYFDKDSIGGTCNDANTGTIDHPFCSPFNKLYNGTWNAPAAGDNIYLRAGTYTGRQFWFKTGTLSNGTEANPIQIKAYPGETVNFDGGVGYTDYLIMVNTTTAINGVHFLGPFNIQKYDHVLYGTPVTSPGFRKGWAFKNFTINDGGTGLYAATYGNLMIDNITCNNLKKQSTHNMCVGVRGYSGQNSYDITVQNITTSNVYDGRSADERGDADGVWTDNYCTNITFENIVTNNNEEDGLDTKCQNVTMKNIQSYNNGATGIKLWGGNLARTSTYRLSNIVSYNNGETGIKCSGNGDTVAAFIDHLTVWANGEDNIKNVQGFDGSNGCIATWRNSLVGGGTALEGTLYVPSETGKSATNHLSYINITDNNGGYAIANGCSPTSTKYTLTQLANGTWNTDMSTGVNCGTGYGYLYGSGSQITSFSPGIVSAPDTFLWSRVATGSITSNVLTLLISANLTWPSPAVGEYIEINSDGVRRQITAKDDLAHTITFSPAVSTTYCSSSVNCIGTKVVGYGADGSAQSVDFSLAADSYAIDAGLWVSGVHCALSDDNGGTGLTGCVHWYGTAPDLGYKETTVKGTNVPKPQIIDIKSR